MPSRGQEEMKLLRLCLISSLAVTIWLGGRPVEAVSETAQEQVIHVVQPGENLFRIALRYGTTVESIVAANGLASAHLVYAGQRLVIPRGSAVAGQPGISSGTYLVQPGDTLSSIALRYGVTMWALMQANGLFGSHMIYAGQRLVIPAAATETSDTYVVRAGDTLYQIAQRFGTTAFALARLNGISNPSAIYVGQVLRVRGEMPAYTGGSKRIVVDLSEQHLYAYEGERLVYSFVASSGRAPYYTRTGEFRVQSKIPKAYGGTWGIWMPYWLGIYWAGSTENGIHALPILPDGQTLWAGYLGQPVSYGCIVLGTQDAKALYDWAEIGTPVSIRP